MADLTGKGQLRTTRAVPNSLFLERLFLYDPIGDSAEDAATHNWYDIPDGYALIEGGLIVTTAFTSGGSATLQAKIGSLALTGAVPVAALTLGTVIPFAVGVAPTATLSGVDTGTDMTAAQAATIVADLAVTLAPVSGGVRYFPAAADTVDLVVGTAAFTAGKAVGYARFLAVEEAVAQGRASTGVAN